MDPYATVVPNRPADYIIRGNEIDRKNCVLTLEGKEYPFCADSAQLLESVIRRNVVVGHANEETLVESIMPACWETGRRLWFESGLVFYPRLGTEPRISHEAPRARVQRRRPAVVVDEPDTPREHGPGMWLRADVRESGEPSVVPRRRSDAKAAAGSKPSVMTAEPPGSAIKRPCILLCGGFPHPVKGDDVLDHSRHNRNLAAAVGAMAEVKENVISVESVLDVLLRHSPDMLHVLAHYHASGSVVGILVYEDPNNLKAPGQCLSEDDFVATLKEYQRLTNNKLRLVVLSVCRSLHLGRQLVTAAKIPCAVAYDGDFVLVDAENLAYLFFKNVVSSPRDENVASHARSNALRQLAGKMSINAEFWKIVLPDREEPGRLVVTCSAYLSFVVGIESPADVEYGEQWAVEEEDMRAIYNEVSVKGVQVPVHMPARFPPLMIASDEADDAFRCVRTLVSKRLPNGRRVSYVEVPEECPDFVRHSGPDMSAAVTGQLRLPHVDAGDERVIAGVVEKLGLEYRAVLIGRSSDPGPAMLTVVLPDARAEKLKMAVKAVSEKGRAKDVGLGEFVEDAGKWVRLPGQHRFTAFNVQRTRGALAAAQMARLQRGGLRLWFLGGFAESADALRVSWQCEHIKKTLGAYSVESNSVCHPDALAEGVSMDGVTIVHVAAHACPGPVPGLLFYASATSDAPRIVTCQELAGYFGHCPSVELLFLYGFNTLGLAQHLVMIGISYVLCIDGTIPHAACVPFVTEFYKTLSRDRDVVKARHAAITAVSREHPWLDTCAIRLVRANQDMLRVQPRCRRSGGESTPHGEEEGMQDAPGPTGARPAVAEYRCGARFFTWLLDLLDALST